MFNGPSNDSGHRRMPLQLFGRSAFAQRYAIDYMLVDAEGRASPVEGGDNDTYPGYGAEVIAVADGVISSVLDGVPENRPGETSRPADFNLSTAIGNHVILDIGEGRYALYAHLLPRSVPVQVGQQVRRGQVLGQVGNSGNSGGPHLHFHITDEKRAAGCGRVAVRARRLRPAGLLPPGTSRAMRDARARDAARRNPDAGSVGAVSGVGGRPSLKRGRDAAGPADAPLIRPC